MTRYRLVRIYTLEGEAPVEEILRFLHDEHGVCGILLLRAIAGYDDAGRFHTASLLALSLKLPLVIEFFDREERVLELLPLLKERFSLSHILSWPVESEEL